MLASLFGVFAITRILSPAEYGKYAFVLSVITLCQGSLLSWVEVGSKRFFERAVQDGRLAEMCVTIYLGLGISALVLLASFAGALGVFDASPEMAALLWIGAAVCIAKELSMLSKVLELAALSRMRYVLMECGESLVGVALGLWLCWHFNFGADGILYGMLVGALTVVAFDARHILRRLRGGAFDLSLQWQILTFSAPVAVALFIEYLMFSADRMMVQFFLGPAELGIYAVGYSIAERSVTAVFMALGIASYPLVVRALERDGPAGARRQARQNIEVMMAIALPAWGGFTVASGHIAAVLVGPAFAAQVAELLPLSGLAVFIYSLRVHYFGHAQHLANRTWSLLLASAPAALVNIGLNALLLPSIGVMGAVWARLIAYVLALGINLWLCHRQFPLPFPARGIAKASLATVAMCGMLHMLELPQNAVGLAAFILIGGVFYALLAIAFDIGGLRSMWLVRRGLRPGRHLVPGVVDVDTPTLTPPP
jgi:O-antigen/teichoic acid export membrane protein